MLGLSPTAGKASPPQEKGPHSHSLQASDPSSRQSIMGAGDTYSQAPARLLANVRCGAELTWRVLTGSRGFTLVKGEGGLPGGEHR